MRAALDEYYQNDVLSTPATREGPSGYVLEQSSTRRTNSQRILYPLPQQRLDSPPCTHWGTNRLDFVTEQFWPLFLETESLVSLLWEELERLPTGCSQIHCTRFVDNLSILEQLENELQNLANEMGSAMWSQADDSCVRQLTRVAGNIASVPVLLSDAALLDHVDASLAALEDALHGSLAPHDNPKLLFEGTVNTSLELDAVEAVQRAMFKDVEAVIREVAAVESLERKITSSLEDML